MATIISIIWLIKYLNLFLSLGIGIVGMTFRAKESRKTKRQDPFFQGSQILAGVHKTLITLMKACQQFSLSIRLM